MTPLHCNKLNPAAVLPSVPDKVPPDCLMLMDHLLTPHDDLQAIPLGNTDFSWLTDGSYLNGDNGKYRAEYAIATPFDIVEAAYLPMATLTQQAELFGLTQACTLAKSKTAHIYTDSKYACRTAHDFGMLCKQCDFLNSSANKSPLCLGIIGCNNFTCLLWLSLRFQGILNLSFWKLKEII